MNKIINKIKQYRFIIILIILLLIKIIIVQVQPLNAKYSMKYDDQLMVEMADNIVNGKWLGEYNSKTLIKGVFTPLFISITYFLHIPFLIGKEIFYGISCLVFILILKNKIKNEIILILVYIVILFNPIEYSNDISRVYRDGIYMSLIMYVLAFSIGIFLSRKENIKNQIKYFIGMGFSISATYLCREENIWLFPYLIIMLGATLLPIIIDKNLKNKKKRIAVYIIPIMIFFITVNIICMLNYKYYGVYTLNQYWGVPFKSAYGALTRVEPNEKKERVPVNKDTLQRLYQYSSKLAELQEFFESVEGKRWEMCGEKIDEEINGGYFHWALMQAVESKGYYQNAKMADNYYKELGKEINDLCDNKTIKSKENKIISNTCYFDFQDIWKVITKIPKTIKYQYGLSKVEITVSNPGSVVGFENEKEKRNQMEKMTNQEIKTVTHYINKWNNIRLKILDVIKDLYACFNKYLIYISTFLFIFFIIINIRDLKRIYEETIILISLLSLYMSRIFVITFSSEMMFKEALNVSYLSCIYNIQFLFSLLAIIFFVQTIRRKYNERKNKINNTNSSIK